MHRVTLIVDIRLEQDHSRVHHMAVLACFPEAAALRSPYIVVFAGPGGGYSKEYYDLQIPGTNGYSQAAHHTRAGVILIAFDHVGVGQSRTDGTGDVSRDTAAAVNDALVHELSHRIGAGTLVPGIEAIPGTFRVLMGQSMGGCLSIIQQGNHNSCDALAVLGYSAIHTVIPQPTVEATAQSARQFMFSAGTDYAKLSDDDIRRSVPPLTYGFFWDDVPAAIVQQDFGGGYPIRQTSPPWGSPTVPRYAMGMTAPGVVAAEAARIEVPVLLAFGERDVSENPWTEPSAFPRSDDVSLYVVRRMAHMHNFAGTRQLLWDRIVGWSRLQAGKARRAAR